MTSKWGWLRIAPFVLGIAACSSFGAGDADAARSSDGGAVASEAGPDSGAVAAFSCPAAALLCDDFEDTPLDKQWDSTNLADGGTIGVFTLPDGGHALSAHTPAHDTSSQPTAYQEKSLVVQPYTPLTVSVDLQISALTNVGIVDFDILRFARPFYRVALRIADYGEGFFLRDYGEPADAGAAVGVDSPIKKLTPTQWTHVVFSISYDETQQARGSLSFDGVPVFNGPLAAGPFANQTALAEVGIVNTESSAAEDSTFLFDHLTVTSP